MNSAITSILYTPSLGKGERASFSIKYPSRINVRQNLPQRRVGGARDSRSQPYREGVYNGGRLIAGGLA